MAELYLTPEEKASDTLAEWSDDALGKLLRRCGVYINGLTKKGLEKKHIGYFAAAEFLLIQQTRATNAELYRSVLKGTSIAGIPDGDWEVQVFRRRPGFWTWCRDLYHRVRLWKRESLTFLHTTTDQQAMRPTAVRWTGSQGEDRTPELLTLTQDTRPVKR